MEKGETRGRLVIVGGHEDKTGERVILREFMALAGGDEARIAVVTTAASNEDQALQTYHEIFSELGAQEILALRLQERAQALRADGVEIARQATGFFFTGGDQLRITSALGGTPVHAAIREAHRRGAVIGGTSAGASMMTDVMIVEGPGDRSPSRAGVRMSPGMGFFGDAVVDQHFAQRGRVNRLFAVVAQNPSILGIGIDEDTAVVVETAPRRFRVIGSQTVTVVDAQGATHSTASEGGDERPLAICGLAVHVLAAGYGYDLNRRLPEAPDSSDPVNRGPRGARE